MNYSNSSGKYYFKFWGPKKFILIRGLSRMSFSIYYRHSFVSLIYTLFYPVYGLEFLMKIRIFIVYYHFLLVVPDSKKLIYEEFTHNKKVRL